MSDDYAVECQLAETKALQPADQLPQPIVGECLSDEL
jgi:hypothetical protein